jgi:uncharacterized protein (TIGR02246 family)
MAAAAMTLTVALLAGNSAAQDKKSKKEPESDGIVSPVPLPDDQAVDLVVSQMLGAWQVGDVEMLHKYYADDVMMVSAAWEPPLVGWQNFARAYQAQYARSSGGLLDRTNSYIKVLGDSAWVTYQWRYTGQMNGNPTQAVGHTTLFLQKRAGSWLIVLNHTSNVPVAGAPAAGMPLAGQPGAAPATAPKR